MNNDRGFIVLKGPACFINGRVQGRLGRATFEKMFGLHLAPANTVSEVPRKSVILSAGANGREIKSKTQRQEKNCPSPEARVTCRKVLSG